MYKPEEDINPYKSLDYATFPCPVIAYSTNNSTHTWSLRIVNTNIAYVTLWISSTIKIGYFYLSGLQNTIFVI